MQVEHLDHFVLTVADVNATISFYETVLGMRSISFGAARKALTFGKSKINLHDAAQPLSPHAGHPLPGSADLCFITSMPIAEAIAHLQNCGVTIEAGPGPRSGAMGTITSVYFRDPDGNLIEVSNYAA